MKAALALVLVASLAACGGGPDVSRAPAPVANLYPGETPQMRALIRQYAARHQIPEALLHKVIQRESDYRAEARNGPYWGLMQILPQTARQMGHQGPPEDLLRAEVNLEYAGRYLKGAYLVADGDLDEAVMWYARGYYYEARDRCLLVETGLRDREVRRECRG
ncbi:transglycosylase SLT domain-containing protein [Roseibaca sp. Y0-43]|uniref:transglycosylase SLT domain-containing protein n=1 Tax=Roseibaca sp. Y0-43 TaxID=2816854 RepID=UPI001D0C2D69|nr:transglycosylase SLT domain-containing protein [Roseibaca sp. Y0-43]MCC1480662.1 transglycosylase SLT domain-containing protein [Roseibaca sp. Y0-43]